MIRFSLLTFGCRVNQAESSALERGMRAAGWEPSDPAQADLVIVNSCSVTATADQGTRQSIRRVARENPSAKIVVTGCYATRAPEDVAALPGVVDIIPNARKDGLVEEVLSIVQVRSEHPAPGTRHPEPGTRHPAPGTPNPEPGTRHPNPAPGTRHPEPLPIFLSNRTTFTLRVQTGCEESCAYCVIPSTRGAERSTPVAAVTEEARRIEAAGYREMTLTGVHLGAYGRDLEPRASLDGLLDAVVRGTSALRFRLGSLEPMDCTAAVIERAADGDRLAPAFHLPLQHASDPILRAMRRPYSCADYDAVVTAIRRRMPHASITADVIVGFPGESDADFDELVGYLAVSPLTQLHVFPYPDRPGTEASVLPGKVHGAVVRERASAVRAVGAQLAEAFRASQVGSVRPALTIEDGASAVTDNGLKVRIPPGRARNEWVRVALAAAGVECRVTTPA